MTTHQTHPTTITTADPIGSFLTALSSGAGIPAEIYAPDATLDATVPNWRLGQQGGSAVAAELSRWYHCPTTLEQVQRRSFSGGEAVEVDLSWTEDGIPHAAHQMHLISVGDGVITSATVFCGGRWPAALLAEMEAARAG
ncbi:MAG: hypothetical protein AAB131_07640 [Actinomycetota bacterium]|jgi:hypothetical protein|nr:MAG: hypothetical protein FD127_3416 [Acidimicrobiaceae bacterium]